MASIERSWSGEWDILLAWHSIKILNWCTREWMSEWVRTTLERWDCCNFGCCSQSIPMQQCCNSEHIWTHLRMKKTPTTFFPCSCVASSSSCIFLLLQTDLQLNFLRVSAEEATFLCCMLSLLLWRLLLCALSLYWGSGCGGGGGAGGSIKPNDVQPPKWSLAQQSCKSDTSQREATAGVDAGVAVVVFVVAWRDCNVH